MLKAQRHATGVNDHGVDATRNPNQRVTHTVHAEADLPELLQVLLYFVQAAGFTYVTKLGALKDGGGEVVTKS